MIYKPKARKKGFYLPFGYYVNPLDPNILIPDQKKLEALHYAFRMKAKYNTTLSSCTMWLHSATGTRITVAGFSNMYRKWLKQLKKDRKAEIDAKKKAFHKIAQNYIDKNYQDLIIEINHDRDTTAVAQKQVIEETGK